MRGGLLQSLKFFFLEEGFLEFLHFAFLGAGQGARATPAAGIFELFALFGGRRVFGLPLARRDAQLALVAVGGQREDDVMETQGDFQLAFVAELRVAEALAQAGGGVSDNAHILGRALVVDEVARQPLVLALEGDVADEDRARHVGARRRRAWLLAVAGGHVGSHMLVADEDGRIGGVDELHGPVGPLGGHEGHVGVAGAQTGVELLLDEGSFATHFGRHCRERSESNALDDLLLAAFLQWRENLLHLSGRGCVRQIA